MDRFLESPFPDRRGPDPDEDGWTPPKPGAQLRASAGTRKDPAAVSLGRRGGMAKSSKKGFGNPVVLARAIATNKARREALKASITPVKGGFVITRPPCPVCGEPPLGGEYCCGHVQEVPRG